MTVILEAAGLRKHFGGAQVINGIDFRIHEGETRCVIGPNGAGKSTFFKLLIGEHKPSEGSIYLRSKEITRLRPFHRVQMGMSIKFQVPGVFPDLTVEEHFRLVLQRASASKRHGELDRLVALFDLIEERDVKAANLSHGKKQWLEIGMAVALQPRILLLDEPVAGLSDEETVRTGELVKRLKSEGLTIMIVEHDMAFVRQVASSVTVLHAGRVFAEGEPGEVLGRDDVADIYLGKK